VHPLIRFAYPDENPKVEPLDAFVASLSDSELSRQIIMDSCYQIPVEAEMF
jgi:hypothetical protein